MVLECRLYKRWFDDMKRVDYEGTSNRGKDSSRMRCMNCAKSKA